MIVEGVHRCINCMSKMKNEKKCRKCGYVNPLSIEEIYETDEDWKNGVRPTDPVRFAAAIAERRQELENERKSEERSV